MRTIGFFSGLGSGLLWAGNNQVFARGYAALCGLFTENTASGVLLPLLGAAINDTAAFLAIFCHLVLCKGIFMPSFPTAKKPLLGLLFAGFLGGFLGSYAYFLAISSLGPEPTLFVTALYPVASVLLARICLQQRISTRMRIGIFVSLLGIWIIYGNVLTLLGCLSFDGLFYALLAAFCWGLEIVLAAYALTEIDAVFAVCIREGISAICLWVALLLQAPTVNLTAPSLLFSGLTTPLPLALLAIGGTLAGLSYLYWYRANYLLGVARGTALNTTYILWGLMFACLSTGENTISIGLALGGLVLFSGILCVVIPAKPQRKA